MMKRLVITILVLVLSGSGGCALMEKKPKASTKTKDWDRVRARIKTQLAERNFEAGNLEEASRQCGQALSLDPENVESCLVLAKVMLARGKADQAATVLEQADQLSPKTPEVNYLRGVVAERENQLEAAVDFYRQAYQSERDNRDYLVTYSEALLRAERWEPLVRLLRSRLSEHAEDPVVYLLLGQACSMLGQADEAADALSMAVQLAPNNHLLREEATLALLEAGRVKGAVSNIRNLLSTEAENVDPLTIRLVATALLEQKQPKEALKLLEPALNAHADDAWCWLLAARSHVEMGKFNKAETALMRSLQKDSGLTEAKLLLAWCKLASGETGAAAASAQEVLKHNPNDVAARTILAQARKKRHYQP